MRCGFILFLLAALSAAAAGQIAVTHVEEIPLPAQVQWMAPGWSPDGRGLFITSANYRGLWRYDLGAKTLLHICDDAGAGFGWSVSGDGSTVAYRRTIAGQHPGEKTQEIVQVTLSTGASVTLGGAGSMEAPVYSGGALVVNDARLGYRTLAGGNPSSGRVSVLGIENTKIVLLQDGKKTLLDPCGDGSYIWPSLSPDGARLVAYEMARGTFVCNLQGNVLSRLGRLDAPSWTRSGAWIISMREENDGHVITGADLFATSPDGRMKIQLTNTKTIELAPACSPTENRIVCATGDGRVLLLTYEETAR